MFGSRLSVAVDEVAGSRSWGASLALHVYTDRQSVWKERRSEEGIEY